MCRPRKSIAVLVLMMMVFSLFPQPGNAGAQTDLSIELQSSALTLHSGEDAVQDSEGALTEQVVETEGVVPAETDTGEQQQQGDLTAGESAQSENDITAVQTEEEPAEDVAGQTEEEPAEDVAGQTEEEPQEEQLEPVTEEEDIAEQTEEETEPVAEESKAAEAIPVKLELNFETVNIPVDSSRTITATVYNQFDEVISDLELLWQSSDEDIVAVDENGVIKGINEGSATITVCSGDNPDLKADCQVNVVAGYGTNLVIISGTTGFTAPIVEAYHNLTEKRNPPYLFGLKVFSSADLDTEGGQLKIRNALGNADAVLLEMLGAAREKTLNSIFADCVGSDWKDNGQPEIFVQRCGEKDDDGTWADKGLIVEIVKGLDVEINKNDDEWTRLNRYLENSGVSNWERLLLYLATAYGNGDVLTEENLEPIQFGGAFVYHPAADTSSELYEGQLVGDGTGLFFDPDDYYSWYESRPGYDADAPWAGIMGYDSSYKNADQEMMLAVLAALERKGLNAILFYPPNNERVEGAREFFYRDLDGDGKKEPALDVFVCAIGFNFIRNDEDKGTKLFKEMNIPVLAPIYSSDLEKWYDDPSGAMDSVHWQVAMPELEGRIEPVLMGGTITMGVDEATGAVVTKKIALPDRIERLAGRAAAWAKLRNTANQDKKVAVIYYNLHGGKDGIGASYLNVPASLTEVLQAMRAAGYKIDDDSILNEKGQITEEKVFEAVFSRGRNIGGWAPGELEKFAEQDGIIKVDLNTYLKWYNKLPENLRKKVEAEWGPAPGKMMVYNGELIIPGVICGNVFFGPQPMRGWGEDISKIIHSPDLPPPHQYLAFYFWLQNEFQADAMVHLGTHGTAEWLPGKSVGLSGEDWPDIIHGDLPNIYPYIVNNPGEATQAKRRGYAVIVDHLTAAVANTELYGNLLELHDLSHRYEQAVDPANDRLSEEVETLQAKIMQILKDEGVAEQIGLDPENTPFKELLDAAHEYLHQLENELTPLGLHTFGVPPQDERFEKMVDAIINYDRENREGIESQIRENLQRTTEEMEMLLLALNGGYIPPGLGKDPVRDPEVMPTGRNIKTFDPRSVPDKFAWETGKKLADELLATYYEEHGSYPESTGVILWAIETMRTDGQSIGMVMRLLGIEPVWDKSGRVKSYQITPVDELGHPRIDVVVSMSGLFRDTFSVVSELLDSAVRELAQLDEPSGKNYVKKHFDKLKEQFIKQGKSESEAEFLAGSRIFSEPPGTYGVGLSEQMNATGSWDNRDDLVETYLSRMSYIYGSPTKDGEPVFGVEGRELFESVLKDVQAVVQVRDSIYGALDNDDVAQYLGGLVMAAKWASGKDVDAYIANTRLGADKAKIQTFQQFVSQELHSRLLNPKFIEEMLKEGYAGSETIAKWVGNTFFVDATTDAIADWAWQGIASSYVFDEAVRSKLDPYALQSLIAYTTEAARKGFWDASQEDLQKLSDVYVQTMVDYGVVCCHHTCNNVVFNEWLAQFSTLDQDTLKNFEKKLTEATNKNVKIPVKEPESENKTVKHKSKNKSKDTPPKDENKEQPKPQEPVTEIPKPQEEIPAPVPAPIKTPETPPTPPVATTPAGAGEKVALSEPAAANVSAAGPQPAQEQVVEQPAEEEKDSVDAEVDQKSTKYKAYEVTPEEEAQKTQGVNFWAIIGAVAVTLIIVIGFARRKK